VTMSRATKVAMSPVRTFAGRRGSIGLAAIATLGLAATVLDVSAQAPSAAAYPDRVVKIVVPYPPGGAIDPVARAIAQRLTERWPHPVIVENRPGGNTFIAAEAVAKAAPDGYTLIVAAVGTLAVNPNVYARLPYDPARDYAPITKLADLPLMLVVAPSAPWQSVADVIDAARREPGKLTFASGGAGQGSHLAGELFKSMAGISITHVPYKGNAPAVADVMGGHVGMIFDGMAASLPNVRAGKLRALAVTTTKRSASIPELPTVAESGLPGFEVASWFGLLAPAGTPAPVIAKLNAAVVPILKEPDVVKLMDNLGLEPAPGTPDEFAAYIRAEQAKWARVVREAKIQIE
jgi:tripartite-type tricarboxylate transporter receptor subunit TctC